MHRAEEELGGGAALLRCGVIRGGDKQPAAGRAPLCLTLGFFSLLLMEQAPTPVPGDSVVGAMLCMALHLELGFHSPPALVPRDSRVLLVFKLESPISVQLQMHHLPSMAELLPQALGSLPFCGKCIVQWLGWSSVIPVFFRHLSLVSRLGQRCFTEVCILLSPNSGLSCVQRNKGQLVGGPYL